MTLAEAILHAREVAERNRKQYKNCPSDRTDIRYQTWEECAEEHEQLAKWLEELKSYRTSVFSGDMRQIMLKEEYCKAVDDFAEKLNEKCDGMIKDKWNSNVAPISWAEAYADFKDDIDDIAEQLKASVTNDWKRNPKTSQEKAIIYF